MRLHQYNVFPNMSLLTNADHLTVLTSRPGADPDRGELVMIVWMRMPPGSPANQAGRRPAERPTRLTPVWF